MRVRRSRRRTRSWPGAVRSPPQHHAVARGRAWQQARLSPRRRGAAKGKTEAAKSALEQVGSIVASLPENLRFAGLLVLVGAVLMSVATIQFGGTSLF